MRENDSETTSLALSLSLSILSLSLYSLSLSLFSLSILSIGRLKGGEASHHLFS